MKPVILATECYVQQGGKTLMMLRNKKDADINEGKWVGVGGKLEPGESPEQCLIREAAEETGLQLTSYRLRGMISFMTLDCTNGTKNHAKSDQDESEQAIDSPNKVVPRKGPSYKDQMLIFVYTADSLTGEPDLDACTEGSLSWVETKDIGRLNLWAGDRLFWDWMNSDKGLFSARFVYRGEELFEHEVSFY